MMTCVIVAGNNRLTMNAVLMEFFANIGASQKNFSLSNRFVLGEEEANTLEVQYEKTFEKIELTVNFLAVRLEIHSNVIVLAF